MMPTTRWGNLLLVLELALVLACAAAQPTSPGFDFVGEGFCNDADDKGAPPHWPYYQNIAKDFKPDCAVGAVDCLRSICNAACTAAEFTVETCTPGAADCSAGDVVSCVGTTVEPTANVRCRLHVPARVGSVGPVIIDGAEWVGTFHHASPDTEGPIAAFLPIDDLECWKRAGAGAAGDANTADDPGSSAAIVAADTALCYGDVTITYSDGELAGESPIAFRIGGDGAGEVRIPAGTMVLRIAYKSCDGVTRFEGESLPIAYSGSGSGASVEINALSTQTYDDVDGSVDVPPIIVSMQVSPSHVAIDQPTTLSFLAVDPVPGDWPKNYTLVVDDAHADITGAAECLNQPDGDGDGRTTCELVYTPRPGNVGGNIPFTMIVTDVGGQRDQVPGSIGVDALVGVGLDVDFNHAPLLSSPASAGQEAEFGQSLTITFTATDLDIPKGDETLELVLGISKTQQLTEADTLKAVGCEQAQMVATATTVVGSVQSYELRWSPWEGVAGSASEFGETWCEIELMVKDADGQESQLVKYTVAAIGTHASGNGFGAVPLFGMVYAPSTARRGDEIELFLMYSDPDSLSTLVVETNGLSAVDPAAVAGKDCSSPCREYVKLQVDGTVGATYTVTATLSDDADPSKSTTRQFAITVTAAPSRLRRAPEAAGQRPQRPNLLKTSFTISDGRLTASTDEPLRTAGPTTAVALTQGTKDAAGVRPDPSHPHPASVELARANNDGAHSSDSSAASTTALVAVGCTGLAIAAIAAAVVAVKRSRRGTPVAGSAPPTLEVVAAVSANEQFEQFEHLSSV